MTSVYKDLDSWLVDYEHLKAHINTKHLLYYLELSTLVSKTLTIESLESISDDIKQQLKDHIPEPIQLIKEVHDPRSAHPGDRHYPHKIKLAKYGLLELKFQVDYHRVQVLNTKPSTQILDELGFMPRQGESMWVDIEIMLLRQLIENREMQLLLLLKNTTVGLTNVQGLTEESPYEDIIKELSQQYGELPELFPMEFTIADACITNIQDAWKCKQSAHKKEYTTAHPFFIMEAPGYPHKRVRSTNYPNS